MRLPIVGIFLLLAACVNAPPPPIPQSPQQAWYAAKAAYSVAVQSAADYKVSCQRKNLEIQARCMEIVAKLRATDAEAETYELLGDSALADGEQGIVIEATEQLEELRNRLEEDLAASMEGD